MQGVTVFDHPLIKHKVSILRDVNTGTNEFRKIISEISTLMAFEVTRDLSVEEYKLNTPLEETTGYRLAGKKLGLVPILRAGLGMVDGMINILPSAKVGHIGLYRDPETLEIHEYYVKLPTDIQERQILLLDPMVATGGSVIDAIDSLKSRGANAIKLLCIIAAPEGIKKIKEAHPDVEIFIASLDRGLNDHAYIVPGLGDAGDRLFGTK